MFAHAIGVRPTKDNFGVHVQRGRYGNDTETRNRLQSLVSTLSTGPVLLQMISVDLMWISSCVHADRTENFFNPIDLQF